MDMEKILENEQVHNWRRGISTRYAMHLSCRDIKKFVEEELNLKCGRIVRRKNTLTYAIEFVICKPFSFRKNLPLQGPIPIQSIGESKIVFEAYDFNFELSSEYVVSQMDKYRWLDFMSKKFGKPYEDFMLVYSEI